MRKFLAALCCACLFSAVVSAGTIPTSKIHPSLSFPTTTVAPLTITSGTPPSGKVGLKYGPFHYIMGRTFHGFILTASGGVGSYSWRATGLPPGIGIRTLFWGGSTRCCLLLPVIMGTPTTAGTYTAVITVTDSASPTPHHKSATYTIKIVP